MRRLTILLAALAALLLVPVAQAAASGNMYVSIAGHGKGEVSSVEGLEGMECGESCQANWQGFGPFYEGSPPIQCSGPPASGTCETPLVEDVEGLPPMIAIHAIAASGSEFRKFTFQEAGSEPAAGCEPGRNQVEEGENPTWCIQTPGGGGNVKLTALFCKEGESTEACEAETTGPTNLRTLTLTKSAGGTTGTGAVSSKPKGINCGSACDSAVASIYENQTVVLKAKASTGSSLTGWSGCEAETVGPTEGTCTVAMSKDQSVEAIFGPTSKAILNPQPLTLSKGESTGKGTVKAAGLACEAECTSTTALYQGPTGIAPKNKPGKLVTLKEVPVFGSEFTGWSGCESEAEGNCLVTMEEAAEVTAEFAAKPTTTLTLNKGGTGTGAVSSKPKAINCGTTCTTQDATVPEGEAIVLKEKPGTGMTFSGWSGGGCSGTAETCTVSLSEASAVTASFSGTPKPIANQQELTLTKAGSGYGTVKAAGLTCEVLCTSTVSLYQGPTGIAPKNKPGKTVVLKALSAPGSKAVQWSGCTPISPSECEVVMEEAEAVTATFDELE